MSNEWLFLDAIEVSGYFLLGVMLVTDNGCSRISTVLQRSSARNIHYLRFTLCFSSLEPLCVVYMKELMLTLFEKILLANGEEGFC